MKNIIFFTTTILVSLSLTTTPQFSMAQGSDDTYQAYLNHSKTLWERNSRKVYADQFELAMIYYGLLYNTMAEKDEETFDTYYDKTLDLLETLIEDGQHVAECKAMQSSIYGLAIAYSSWKGMYLGPKCGSTIEQAMELDPDSPLVRKLYGGYKLHTPAMFGGDPEEAVRQFKKAVSLYEAQGDTIANWLYLDALVHIGIAYDKLGKEKEAVLAFENTLRAEPEFKWVKYLLLPAVKRAESE